MVSAGIDYRWDDPKVVAEAAGRYRAQELNGKINKRVQ
jgi:hypothetical protein